MTSISLPVQPRGDDDIIHGPTHTLNVGTTQVYNLTGEGLDFVVFHFPADPQANHSIVQTTSFDTPCVFQSGGFSSGLHPAPSSDLRVQLQHNYPIYFACVAHCHDGEVGVINLRGSSPFEALVQAARNSVPDFSRVPLGPSGNGDGHYGAVVVLPGAPGSEDPEIPEWIYIVGIIVGIAFISAVAYCAWTMIRLRMKIQLKEVTFLRRLIHGASRTDTEDRDQDRTLVEMRTTVRKGDSLV